MIFVTEAERGRGRDRRVRETFGNLNLDKYRSYGFDSVELESEDLKIMLDIPEHEIKNKIYDLLRIMEHSEHQRRRDRNIDPRGFSSRVDPYREQRMHTMPKNPWELPEIPITGDAAVLGKTIDKIKVKPKPDKSGLLWLDED